MRASSVLHSTHISGESALEASGCCYCRCQYKLSSQICAPSPAARCVAGLMHTTSPSDLKRLESLLPELVTEFQDVVALHLLTLVVQASCVCLSVCVCMKEGVLV